MEKFTVDLDKVLDDFEFNEEQAVRQAQLNHEDLPAKKYERPHFQPINIADADFSPSIETTMPYTSYHRKHSQDSTNSSIASDSTSHSFKYTEVNHVAVADLVEPPVFNNFHNENTDSYQCNDVIDEKTLGLVANHEIVNQPDDPRHIEPQEEVAESQDDKSINLDIVPGINVEEVSSVEESQSKPDLLDNEFSNEEIVSLEESNTVSNLPDLTEINQETLKEREFNKIGSFDLIMNDKDTNGGFDHSQEVNEINESVSPPELTSETFESQDSAVAPVQFQNQLDITDEDLQKYLEELEEEEERGSESEVKPVRPGFLDLNETVEAESPGSPGLTPLPKREDKAEEDALASEQLDLEEENSRNEQMEVAEAVRDNVAPQEELEQSDETEHVAGVSNTPSPTDSPLTVEERRLGRVSPFWMPDHLAAECMDCHQKFTVIKRRHHCRACGRILCSKCCGMRASLEYLQNKEQRVCGSCFHTLAKVMMYELQSESENESSPRRRPNPNNPMEYCSTVPPPLQVSTSSSQPPPSVLVPVGVLKREGSSKIKESTKQVMFSDGIRPGGDLTELDGSPDQRNTFRKAGRVAKRVGTPPGNVMPSPVRMLPPIDPNNQSFVLEKGLPPVCVVSKGETTYQENWPHDKIMERLKDQDLPPLTFAVNRNLIVSLKIVKLECCMNKTCWALSTKGMGCVGQDEFVILLAFNEEDEDLIPREIFLQLHYIYQEAAKGNTVNELGFWCVKESTFLNSKQHGGFLFIRPTFQCLNHINTPPPPFLVGVLIHRSEIPWARVFPIRLMLRLGAEFRYYPCPLISVRFREPVYYEIGHTIIKLLADFRNLSYTLPSVRGLRIHMEAKQTCILIPRNRYDQVVRALNNSNDPVLALAGNFSTEADAHLVCMQSKGDEITYNTQAINIHDKPRKVTGASFVVLNGALKTTSGLAAKSSIVEDGLMVQVPSETMAALRTKLRNMEDWSVRCGPIDGETAEEVVKITWCEDDKNFNIGVKSVVDNMPLDGVPSIRVHSGTDYMGCTRFIRWTQVFIIKCEDGATSAKIGDPLEVNKLSESIARATCIALTKLLDLLAASGLTILAVRATIDQDNVGYEAGSNGEKLAPIYMNSLDNELIPVLHKAASLNDSVAVLELTFHIMDQ